VSAFFIDRLVVVGVGLIGGSVAAALRACGRVGRVVGVGRGRANIERALALGVIDETADSVAAAAETADLVLLAVPVGQNDSVLGELKDAITRGVIVTDAGSTKRDFVDSLRHVVGTAACVVPAHPIAGAEKTGVEAASATLFENRRVVLTPIAETDPGALNWVEAMWAACGARVTRMDPEQHDRIFSAVSHLPHALAFALVELIASRDNADELFSFAAGGFRDFTRIAGSSPEMWRDICMANGDLLAEDIDRFRQMLGELSRHIRAGDADAVHRLFVSARSARENWLKGGE
jgi:prephenate dehydrogenase